MVGFIGRNTLAGSKSAPNSPRDVFIYDDVFINYPSVRRGVVGNEGASVGVWPGAGRTYRWP